MKQLALYVNGQLVDLPNDVQIGYAMEADSVIDVNRKKAATTTSFKLPNTPNNNIVFESIFDTTTVGANVYFEKKLPAEIVVDGFLFDFGNIVIDRVEGSDGNFSYNAVFYSKLADFINMHGEKTLAEALGVQNVCYYESFFRFSANYLATFWNKLKAGRPRYTASESMFYHPTFLKGLKIPSSLQYTYWDALHTFLFNADNGTFGQPDLIRFADGYNNDNERKQTKYNYPTSEKKLNALIAQRARIAYYADALLNVLAVTAGYTLVPTNFTKRANPYYSRVVIPGKMVEKEFDDYNLKLKINNVVVTKRYYNNDANTDFITTFIYENYEDDYVKVEQKTVTINGVTVPTSTIRVKKPSSQIIVTNKYDQGIWRLVPVDGNDVLDVSTEQYWISAYRYLQSPHGHLFKYSLYNVTTNAENIIESYDPINRRYIIDNFFIDNAGLGVFAKKTKEKPVNIFHNNEYVLGYVYTRNNNSQYIATRIDDVDESVDARYTNVLMPIIGGELSIFINGAINRDKDYRLSEFLPDVKVRDFLASYIRFFGLYPVVDENNNVYLYTRNEYYIDDVITLDSYFDDKSEQDIYQVNYKKITCTLEGIGELAEKAKKDYNENNDYAEIVGEFGVKEINIYDGLPLKSVSIEKQNVDEYGYLPRPKPIISLHNNNKPIGNAFCFLFDNGFFESNPRMPNDVAFVIYNYDSFDLQNGCKSLLMTNYSYNVNNGYLVLTDRGGGDKVLITGDDGKVDYIYNKIYKQDNDTYSLYITKPIYGESVQSDWGVFERFFKKYLLDRFSAETKVFEGYFALPEHLTKDITRKFYYFKNRLWVCDKMEVSDIAKSYLKKLTLVSVGNKDNYLNSVNLGGSVAQRYKVTFVVKYNNAPVVNATVTFNNVPIETNNEGKAVFDNILPSVYLYSVTKPGYQTASGSVNVVNQDVEVEVILNKGLYTVQELDDMIYNQGFIPVANATELNNLRNAVTQQMGAGTKWQGSYTTGNNKKYVQVLDIQLNAQSNWQPINTANGFIYDGNELDIKDLNVNYADTWAQGIGLFGNVSPTTILRNIRCYGNVTRTADNGNTYGAGGIAGFVAGGGTSAIINCQFIGNVTVVTCGGGICGNFNFSGGGNFERNIFVGEVKTTLTNADTLCYVGGLIGLANGLNVTSCRAIGTVRGTRYSGTLVGFAANITGSWGLIRSGFVGNYYFIGTSNSPFGDTGGLVGRCEIQSGNTLLVEECFVLGDIIASGRSNVYGLGIFFWGVTIRNCYMIGNITGSTTNHNPSPTPYNAHAIFGYGTVQIINCYYSGLITGVAGVKKIYKLYSGATISNSYWDVTADPNTGSDGGTAKTATEMKQGQINSPDIYTTWSTAIWSAVDNNNYPDLKNNTRF